MRPTATSAAPKYRGPLFWVQILNVGRLGIPPPGFRTDKESDRPWLWRIPAFDGFLPVTGRSLDSEEFGIEGPRFGPWISVIDIRCAVIEPGKDGELYSWLGTPF